MLRPFLESDGNHYVRFRNVWLFRNYITLRTSPRSSWEEPFAAKAENINAVAAAHPELEFYSYYIEKDTDVDFQTDTPNGAWAYLNSLLRLPAGHTACFAVNDFDTFAENFYRTDHHWNHHGSYQGYREAACLPGAG